MESHCDVGNARFVETSTRYVQPGAPLLPLQTRLFTPASVTLTNSGDGVPFARPRRNNLACLAFKLTLNELETVVTVPSHKLVAAKIPGGRPARIKFTVSFVAPGA